MQHSTAAAPEWDLKLELLERGAVPKLNGKSAVKKTVLILTSKMVEGPGCTLNGEKIRARVQRGQKVKELRGTLVKSAAVRYVSLCVPLPPQLNRAAQIAACPLLSLTRLVLSAGKWPRGGSLSRI